VHKNDRDIQKIHMGRAKATKEMGSNIMENHNKNQRGRRTRPQRPVYFEPSSRREAMVEMDERWRRFMEKKYGPKNTTCPQLLKAFLDWRKLQEAPQSGIWQAKTEIS